MDYIGGSIGDKVTFPIDFSSFLGDQALLKLFTLMILDNDSMQIDFKKLELKYDYGNSTIPLSALGINPADAVLDLNYTVT